MRKWIAEFDMPSETLGISMHLKAQSRTLPFAILDGCAPLMQLLLGKGMRSGRSGVPVSGTPSHSRTALFSQTASECNIVSSGDGLLSSLPSSRLICFTILHQRTTTTTNFYNNILMSTFPFCHTAVWFNSTANSSFNRSSKSLLLNKSTRCTS
jgi:hypothetical protein